VKLDSTQIKEDSVVSWKIDTAYYYRDTIFAIVDNEQESLPIVVEIKNILPRIKSLTVGGISQPGDSLLTIAANPGDKLEILLYLEKPFKIPFNSAFHPIVTKPSIMGKLTEKSKNDSVFVYEWAVPNEEISDSSAYLKIEDSGGYGERLYKVHLVVYTECGSVWVAAEKELVKYSPMGTEVARISGNFNSISDIYVNSKNGKLFVADESGNSFSIYNNYGKLLFKDTTLFELPSGIAYDVEGNFVWVADIEDPSSSYARLRRFALISDVLSSASAIYEMSDEMSGPIKGLSINQFQSNFVWFAIPKSDKVGFTIEPPKPKFIEPKFTPVSSSSISSSSRSSSSVSSSSVSSSSRYSSSVYFSNTWNRPSMVSHDPSNGTAWVADSSRVVAIDTSGYVLAKINGFGSVSSVSASKGNVWVSDILSGKVYLFKGPFRGYSQDINLTVISGKDIDGFIAPISVSAYNADGGAWVIDKEAGMVVRLDSSGKEIASGTGLKQPILGKTLQKVE
jgi:hypothetical protein